jgi:hypothetical protein
LLFILQPEGLPDAVTIASLEREYPGFSARNRTLPRRCNQILIFAMIAPPLARQGPGAFEALFGKAERTILR